MVRYTCLRGTSCNDIVNERSIFVVVTDTQQTKDLLRTVVSSCGGRLSSSPQC